jgi:hypothetical protein
MLVISSVGEKSVNSKVNFSCLYLSVCWCVALQWLGSVTMRGGGNDLHSYPVAWFKSAMNLGFRGYTDFFFNGEISYKLNSENDLVLMYTKCSQL